VSNMWRVEGTAKDADSFVEHVGSISHVAIQKSGGQRWYTNLRWRNPMMTPLSV